MVKYVDVITKRNLIGTTPFLGDDITRFLKKITGEGKRVLEFGSGGSTVFFALYDCEVVSYEHSQLYAEKVIYLLMQRKIQHRVKLYVRANYPFEGMEGAEGKFDIVLVDGRKRNHCIELYHNHVKKGGVLALDNSEVEKWQEGVKYMNRLKGWKRKDFKGFRSHSKSNVWIRKDG